MKSLTSLRSPLPKKQLTGRCRVFWGNNHPLPSITILNYPLPSLTIRSITISYHPLPSIVIHYHPLSPITTHYHPLSPITTHYHPLSPITTHYHPAACHFYYSTGVGIRSNSQKFIINSSKSYIYIYTYTHVCRSTPGVHKILTRPTLQQTQTERIRRMASVERNYRCPCVHANWPHLFKYTHTLSTFEISSVATIPCM